MLDIKETNQFKRVELASIVFLQGDDFYQAMTELNPDYNLDWQDWSTDREKIDYMLQWYQDDDSKYMSSGYLAKNINTPFLGYLRKITGYKGYFLISINRRIDYMGLSKILSIE